MSRWVFLVLLAVSVWTLLGLVVGVAIGRAAAERDRRGH